MAERVHVIEDDHRVQTALRRLFEPEGYTVEVAADGSVGLQAAVSNPPVAVVLDLRLPSMSGRDVCREIKRAAPNLPVIILSATTDVIDKVTLLELGADDYVTKPFSPRELLARVRAAVRRSSRAQPAECVTFGEVAVDFTRMQLTCAGHPVTLTAQEFKVLKFMTDNPERVITREELLNAVWGYENYPTTRTVDNHMMKLRQKIEADPANPIHIRTVHGVGYKFVP
jgi:DNA-binding response OmpR family regulator